MSDLIRREDVISAVKRMKHRLTNGSTFEFLLEAISEIPSADRPQGEWVATDDTDEWYGPTYKCNICGSDAIGGHDNYCYNCGARMEGADYE